MKLLLDTHIWLWGLLQPERLSERVAKELSSEENELWLSPISVWETLVLAEKGRITLDRQPCDWVTAALKDAPFKDASLNRAVALQSRQVDLPHQDPADRFLVATAMIYELTFVTADARILDCSEVSLLPNR